jgi:hypothetical protein
MNEEEAKEILKTMKENIDKKYLKTRNSVAIETILNLLAKKEVTIIETKEANRQLSIELQKKDKIINEIEDLCIRKGDDEGEEYGGIIIWNFAHKIMDIIKEGK